MRFEYLPDKVLKDNFGDFARCEGLWREISEEEAVTHLSTSYRVTVETGEPRDFLQPDKALPLLAQGNNIRLPLMWLRERNDKPKCPLCGDVLPEVPALSRADNKTAICSRCGDKEAMEDYLNTRTE